MLERLLRVMVRSAALGAAGDAAETTGNKKPRERGFFILLASAMTWIMVPEVGLEPTRF